MDFSEQIQEITTHVNGITRQAATKHNISFAQAQFLLSVPSEGISISELSNLIGIDISTMSRNVNKLEKLDLIYRELNVKDTRAHIIYLTSNGDDLLIELFKELDKCTSSVLSGLPIETLQTTGDMLEQLNWALLKYHEK